MAALSERHNIVVICDEAHRTQYGFKGRLDPKTGAIKFGLARSLRRALPQATFLAFTGTPLSQDDRDTQAVFGHYISIYDIQQAVEDGATVPIYYESRLARLALKDPLLSEVDAQVEELFGEEDDIPAQAPGQPQADPPPWSMIPARPAATSWPSSSSISKEYQP
jgi:type I restriction enzyme R subunit